MWVSKLKLSNFRNYPSLELELPQGMIILCGDNGQGKSNLLEALYLLSITKSYRATSEREMVHWKLGAPDSPTIVAATLHHRQGKLHAQVSIQPTASPTWEENLNAPSFLIHKQIRINGAPGQAADLVGKVSAVLFTALDLEVILGPPSLRRRYLDILLSQIDSGYLRVLQRYHKTITQRNHLLRRMRDVGSGATDELYFWNTELAKNGSIIIEYRLRLMEHLTGMARRFYFQLTGDCENLEATYQPSLNLRGRHDRIELEALLTDALEQNRSREVAAGISLVGPHRDDLIVRINGTSGSIFGSRGQVRTAVLALRLAEAEYVRQIRQDEPILLFDDVLSELDHRRRSQVLELAGSYQQTILTTTDWDRVDPWCFSRATRFKIQEGSVTFTPSEHTLAPSSHLGDKASS